jgi:hypothetical protein
MERLILEYRESRKILRAGIKRTEKRIEYADEIEVMDLKNDLSLMHSMLRDLTEAISIMRSPFYEYRGQAKDDKVIYLDPEKINSLDISPASWDPDTEHIIRSQIRDKYWTMIQSRMDLLTNKQKSTLERWVIQDKSISDISRDDGVSRQAVWVRLFGDRTNKGAMKILRDGR